MKLLINTESLTPPVTGIGTYTLNLLHQYVGMSELENIECFSGHRFTTAQQALSDCETNSKRNSTTGVRTTSGLNNLLRSSTLAYRAREALRNALLRLKSTHLSDFIYHEPNFILKAHKGPSVATIHDLSFLHYPQYHPAKRVAWLTSELPKTIARADILITDSELVRRELIDTYSVDEQRVRAIHLGAAPCYAPLAPEQTRNTLEQYGLEHGQYLLFVGTLEPRKGVDTLLESWYQLPKIIKKEFPLVLAGAPGWGNKALQQRIASLMKTDGLRHLSFVPNSDLPALYAGAAVFVYPSRYEGFGLPVLEAMSCGAPVICTADTSMSEITGDCALHIQSGDIQQLTCLLHQLLDDVFQRAELATAGLNQAQNFSWEKCAQDTLEIYRLLGASRK